MVYQKDLQRCKSKPARWSSGQDGGLSRRKREFDSPTGHQEFCLTAVGRNDILDLLQRCGRSKVRVHGDEGTPVPIPNTVVKLINGDNTWLATAREDNTTRTQMKDGPRDRPFSV